MTTKPEFSPEEVDASLRQLPEAPLSIHIDTYYKGFHAGITIRTDDNSVVPTGKIMTAIDSLIEKGFEPSWNVETNNAHSTPSAQPVQTPAKDLGVCSKCGAPNLLSRAGKVYCSKKCWL